MKRLPVAGVLALALLVAGCGGGGGGSSGGSTPSLQALDQQTLVVQMDQNGDNELDLITLDMSESPFVILECLHGMPGGDFRDVTDLLKGLAIDPAVSGAIANHVGDVFGADDRTEIDVTDAHGDPTKVVVFGVGGDGPSTLAATVLAVRPSCASPGDAVLIKGSDFGESPSVSFGGTEAEVLRSDDTRIVCRVPDLDPATTEISVDDSDGVEFHVLAEGAPVIVHLSSETATPGMLLFLIGARLEGADAELVDGDGATAVDLKGGARVAYFKVPEDLEPGTYSLVVTNAAGDTGPCSPTLNVVEASDPVLDTIEPSEQLPGRPVLCKGSDLGPPGICFLTWKGEEDELFGFGFANGYDRVYTWVPGEALAGETYEVTIDLADGASTNSVTYVVGTPPAPEITLIEYEKGPPGSLVGIYGHGLVQGGYGWPTVLFTNDSGSTEAVVYYAFGGYHGAKGGGFGGGGPAGGINRLQGEGGFDNGLDGIVVEVPRSLADGPYEVTVVVNGQESNAVDFEVTDLDLVVTSMRPDHQGPHGPKDVVVITGTGFGVPDYDFVIADDSRGPGLALYDPGEDPFADLFKVTVTWDKGGESLEGQVLWHHDREIIVIPPGGWEDPLPVGEYTVKVTVERDGGDETVVAGTYTVHGNPDGSGNGPPFPHPGSGISHK